MSAGLRTFLSRALRFAAAGMKLVLGLVLFCAAALLSLLVHLQTPLGGEVIKEVSTAAFAELPSHLSVEQASFDGLGIVLEDVRLHSASGRPLIRLAQLDASLDLSCSATEEVICLGPVRGEQGWVDLISTDGEMAIANAFETDSASTDVPELVRVPLRIPSIHLSEVAARNLLGPEEPAASAEGIEMSASLSLEAGLSIEASGRARSVEYVQDGRRVALRAAVLSSSIQNPSPETYVIDSRAELRGDRGEQVDASARIVVAEEVEVASAEMHARDVNQHILEPFVDPDGLPSGTLPIQLDLRAKGVLPELEVNATLSAPDARVAFSMLSRGQEWSRLEGELLANGHYQGHPLGELSAQWRLTETSVEVHSLELVADDARLQGRASIGFSGAVDWTAHGQVSSVQRLLSTHGLDVPAIAGGRADFDLQGSYDNAGLSADLELQAHELEYASVHVEQAAVDATWEDERLDGSIRLQGELGGRRASISLQTDARHSEGGWALGARGVVTSAYTGQIQLHSRVLIDGRRARVQALRLNGRNISAHADGAFRFHDQWMRGNVEVERLDARPLLALASVDARGRMSASVHMEGTLRRPNARATISLRDGSLPEIYPELRIDSLDLGASATPDHIELLGTASSTAGDLGIDARVKSRTRGLTESSLRRGKWDAQLHVQGARLERWEALIGMRLRGKLEADLRVSGELLDPALELTVDGEDLNVPELDELSALPPDMNVKANVSITTGHAAARARIGDAQGTLLVLRGQAFRPEGTALSSLDPRDLRWQLIGELRRRRLSELPPMLASYVPTDGSVEGSFSVASHSGPLRTGPAEPSASLALDIRLKPMFEGRCRGDEPVHLEVHGHLREDQLVAHLRSTIEGREALHAEARSTELGLSSVFQHGVMIPSQISVEAHADAVPIAVIPQLCRSIEGGELSGDLLVEGLLSSEPRGELRATMTNLQVSGEDEVFDLAVRTALSPQRVQVEINSEGDHERLSVTSRLPISWESPWAPEPSWSEGELDASLDAFPVAVITALIPAVTRGEGTISGRAQIRGASREAVNGEARMQLDSVALTVVPIGQRFRNVQGTITWTPTAVNIDGLRTEELDGSAEVRGTVGLRGMDLVGADIRIALDDYPIRWQGLEQARAEGNMDIDFDVREELIEIDVDLSDLDVDVGEELAASLQDLEQHPRVIYESDSSYSVEDTRQALEQHRVDQTVVVDRPISISIKTREYFWVRRADLAALVSLDVQGRFDERGLSLQGPIRLRRGYVTLVGKTFDLEPSTIRFTGATTIDPALDIRAVHDLGAGEQISVRIGGRATAPELHFASNVPGVETEQEALALLARGRQSESEAATQTVTFVTALTGGLLARLTRQRAGQYIPVLSVDTKGDTTQLRAGFDISELFGSGPSSVIRGAYVEGFVGSAGQARTTTGGVLLELLFPHDISTTGRFSQGAAWSADVEWQP